MTDVAATREAAARAAGHPLAGWYRLVGNVPISGADGEVLTFHLISDPEYLGWDEARTLVHHPRDIWTLEYLGKTREGADI